MSDAVTFVARTHATVVSRGDRHRDVSLRDPFTVPRDHHVVGPAMAHAIQPSCTEQEPAECWKAEGRREGARIKVVSCRKLGAP